MMLVLGGALQVERTHGLLFSPKYENSLLGIDSRRATKNSPPKILPLRDDGMSRGFPGRIQNSFDSSRPHRVRFPLAMTYQ
jgi:hypothetical protein